MRDGMLTVAEIWRYPVKSLGGEQVERAAVDELGVEGDRAWGLYEPATDTVLTARREPALLFLSSRLVEGRPVVTTELGAVLVDDDALSRHLGREVELRSASAGPATFENPMDVERETDWMRWQSSGGTFHDGRSKISMVSRGSLADWDPRRFRSNLLLDGAGEDDLVGDLTVGSATLSIRRPIDRCVMIARAQPGLGRDLDVLRRVIRERDNRLGIGLVVERPGTIAVGDAIVPA